MNPKINILQLSIRSTNFPFAILCKVVQPKSHTMVIVLLRIENHSRVLGSTRRKDELECCEAEVGIRKERPHINNKCARTMCPRHACIIT